ncbi:hypothetical protein GOP47_0008296 [Adiantum capillus-veneris]|uniref:Uncharacterized protein n=1 Tax=Adiantum capillus-veneris TaxID=13818 RepID=A0A9D4UY54_ADICA|nr:hypothetical protein GOP47_0008296 [Adiantum capillus-veneris]
MSKRIEGQEVEAFSSFGSLVVQNPFEGSSFSMPANPSTSVTIGSSSRFLEPPLEQEYRNRPSSSSANPNSRSNKQAHHNQQLQANVCSHQPTYENGDSLQSCTHITTLPPPDQHLLREYDPKPVASARLAPAKPLSVVTGIFTCWSKSKEKSGSFQHPLTSRQPLNKLSAPILLEQARLQQEALAETQDTRDMWEWQMEQQQDITSQEHTLLERNSVENPLKVLPELMGRSNSVNRSINSTASMLGQVTRTDSRSSFEQGREGIDGDEGINQKVVSVQSRDDLSASGSIMPAGAESPSWDVHNQLTSIWLDADLVSAMMLLFESALLRCRAEVAYFCRVYMQQMVLSGYALIRTLMEMEPNTVFARKVHASYALEAHVHTVMFQCFESDSFDKSGLTRILDPLARATARAEEYVRMKGVDAEEALRAGSNSYDEAFHAYCAAKSEEIMGMFSWMSMGYRSAAERDRFMEGFLRAAKWVWLLHRLANSTHPPMHIFRVGRGHVIDPAYVESVSVPPIGTCPKCSASSPPKVEFMIMPGFISPSRKIFRCKAYQHYICKHN